MPQRPLLTTYAQSLASTSPTNIRFLLLPTVDPPAPDHYESSVGFLSLLIQKHTTHIRDALLQLAPTDSTDSTRQSVRLAALFVDMFSTTIIDVAAEFAIPCYLFFASPASFLGFMLHLTRVDSANSLNSEEEFRVPNFKNPLPRCVLPNLVMKGNDGFSWIQQHARRYKETKGIVVNTFQELEPHAVQSLSCGSNLPPVYPIGPVLDLNGSAQWNPNLGEYRLIMEWLDQQPLASVVLLCFGSLGSLKATQVEQIAIGLERAGVRFLWALREPPKAQLEDPTEFENLENVLPDRFLERTGGIGLVSGWVPQAKVLGHKAIGGFVSHCGWNSILESLWYGVPIATWPLYAEQQMNAFEMVRELGLAVEIRLDYRTGGDLVWAEEVERGVRLLMNGADGIRRKVKEMSEKCRVALMENGSSYSKLVSLIQEFDKLTSP
ncbi:UDP-glycosyltransferase 43 [Stylosanthes scabra]|uniref:Glycosyltransferase n=1 Tax=Stylosanthes scabra TaxID=79078 RepID=A0ABU6W2F1_9FABA|nr:UDP-glycosyltransferase 43 [Stylosanthes scabra]